MKKVLVTGGVRGIGLSIALAFLKKGYLVYVGYSKDEESANRAKEAGLIPLCFDVASEREVLAAFSQTGGVDILVNNAGIALVKQIQDTTIEEFERVTAVNLRGAFLCAREAVKSMLKKGGGLIVNIASVWGEVGGSCESVYSASKGGLIAFTKALAAELGYSKIRVNAVSPGAIDTRMNACFSKEEKEAIVSEIPLGRMGEGEDVAKAVLFLEENEYVTGVDLPVNGGFSIV
ncbi:MAG: SDR family oxidoreductase [Clostridia bacterium]|nr:SDR family oxidoreductase [Clostridia bacterium]